MGVKNTSSCNIHVVKKNVLQDSIGAQGANCYNV